MGSIVAEIAEKLSGAAASGLTVDSSITLKEQAAAGADLAAYGQIWVDDAVPNELYFTTDAGNDIQITSGTSLNAGTIRSAFVHSHYGSWVMGG